MTPVRISSRLSFPPDSVIRSETDHPDVIGFPGLTSRFTEKRAAALKEALGNVVVLNADVYIFPDRLSVLFKTTEDLYNQFGEARGAYSARVDFSVHKYETAEIALERGARLRSAIQSCRGRGRCP